MTEMEFFVSFFQDAAFHLALPPSNDPVDWAYGVYWEKSRSSILTYRYSMMSHQDTESTLHGKEYNDLRKKDRSTLPGLLLHLSP